MSDAVAKQKVMTVEELREEIRANWSEAEFQAALVEKAQELDWIVASFRAVQVVRRDGSTFWQTPTEADGNGWPDLFLVRGDRAIAAELKVGKNTLSAAQRRWLASLEAAGITAVVWRPADWAAIVKELT